MVSAILERILSTPACLSLSTGSRRPLLIIPKQYCDVLELILIKEQFEKMKLVFDTEITYMVLSQNIEQRSLDHSGVLFNTMFMHMSYLNICKKLSFKLCYLRKVKYIL